MITGNPDCELCRRSHEGCCSQHFPSDRNGIGVTHVAHERSRSGHRAVLTITLDETRPEALVVAKLLANALATGEYPQERGSFAEHLRRLADECDAEVARHQLQRAHQEPTPAVSFHPDGQLTIAPEPGKFTIIGGVPAINLDGSLYVGPDGPHAEPVELRTQPDSIGEMLKLQAMLKNLAGKPP